jgi:hypothetical protein
MTPANSLIAPSNPGASLVNHDLLGTIRSLSRDWNTAVRFRGWLVERIFQSSPHRERDEEKWAEWAEVNAEIGSVGRFQSARECRDYYWREELKERPATIRLVWSAPDQTP